jgi:hypothetical protein
MDNPGLFDNNPIENPFESAQKRGQEQFTRSLITN